MCNCKYLLSSLLDNFISIEEVKQPCNMHNIGYPVRCDQSATRSMTSQHCFSIDFLYMGVLMSVPV